MKKINKFRKIGLATLGILAILSLAYLIQQKIAVAQVDSSIPPTPEVKAIATNGQILISWKISEKSVYGFKIERKNRYADNRRIIAILNPKEVGYEFITDSGFYVDEDNIIKTYNYVYFVTAFDRQGNESKPGTITVVAE